MAQNHDCVVILDFGAINAQITAKAVRNFNIYCEVLPFSANTARIQALKPKAVIYQRSADFGEHTLKPEIPRETLELGLPVLDFRTIPFKREILEEFLVRKCGLKQDWTPEVFIKETVKELRGKIGSSKVLLALSGGVDSSVCAALLHRAAGSQLTCVFVDHGFMRKDEPEQIRKVFKGRFGINLVSVDAKERFLEKLKGVTNPEEKRKIVGEEFIRIFEEEARKLGEPDFFVQGTIYPDIIESGQEGGKPVKAHHNVGGLPERIDFKGILEPVKYLFKDEVRKVGEALDIPCSMTQRQPFPGPGLAVRCLGELTKEKVDILREADAVFCSEMEKSGYASRAGQYFAVLTNVRSVGVTDNERTYGYVICLRAVQTTDFMTAGAVSLPADFLIETAEKIAGRVKGVNRVVYDITGKPPATIEWE